jgi:xanthine dehydrogenase accessory factor
VGYELVPVLSHIGFYTVVIDDREEFSCKERFPAADETITIDMNDAFSNIEIDGYSYIVIVTRGHMHDYGVLKNALKTNACYIGMIGSSKKWVALQEKMLEEGFTKDDIDRVHAPIGMRIMAETPEEIAISIAGEMIKARAQSNL